MYVARFSTETKKKQSVKKHLINVGYYCEKFGKVTELVNTAKLLGYVHDIGKYSAEFQDYIKEAEDQTKKGTYDEWKKTVEKIDHGVYGAKYIYDRYCKGQTLYKLTAEIIAEVVCYHHGGLPDNINDKDKVPLLERMNKISTAEIEEVVKIFEEENDFIDINKLFDEAVEEIKNIYLKTGDKSRFWLGMIIKYLYSMLVDADRLDSYLFEVEEDYEYKSGTKELWEKYNEKLKEKLEYFRAKEYSTLTEKTVADTRAEISENCYDFSFKPEGIYTLTVPTGGGKTLSSLRFALNHAKIFGKQRIFYIIPYTTIIEQNAQDVRKTLDCGENLLEYHSNVMDCNKNEDYEIMSERWDSPIVFTTMVQFLSTVYCTGNHNIRRLHNLENSVIIFDEIQTLPIRCIQLFYECISYLNKIAKSTMVLCSATQPNLDILKSKIKFETNGEIIKNVNEQFEKLKRMEVVDKIQDGEYDIKSLSKFVLELKKNTQSVLVVMNTVSSAENLLNELESVCSNKVKLYFLSSRLCAAHRWEIIDNLKKSLSNHEQLICVSTQLIEAGIDISFTATVRSLSGLDSIAQTTGRGNRHGENKICNSYIVKVKEENISMLDEIKMGQVHTKTILNLYGKNPQKYDNSLLSPKSIATYYDSFYNDDTIKDKMDYPFKNDSIYKLLCNLKKWKNRYTNGKFPLIFSYQFKTARENFEVIDSKTQTIIVPYKEGKELISDILGNNSLKEKVENLKKAQHYSVNIYENLFRTLKDNNAFIDCDIEGINLLSDAFYDDKKGVAKNKKLKMYIG